MDLQVICITPVKGCKGQYILVGLKKLAAKKTAVAYYGFIYVCVSCNASLARVRTCALLADGSSKNGLGCLIWNLQ